MDHLFQLTLPVPLKPPEEIFPVLLGHIVLLDQALLLFLIQKAFLINLVNILQKSVGREKNQVIAMPLSRDFMQIAGDVIVFLPSPPGITARHIPSNKKPFPARVKGGLGINLIILFVTAEQPLIILDGKKCSGKENRARRPAHTLLQIDRRINTEQLQQEFPVFSQEFRIDHIVVVQPVVDIQKMGQKEIKFQNFFPYRALVMLLQPASHGF